MIENPREKISELALALRYNTMFIEQDNHYSNMKKKRALALVDEIANEARKWDEGLYQKAS